MLTKIISGLPIFIRILPIGKQFQVLLITCLVIQISGASLADQTSQIVTEPIFNSKVYIEEYGKQNKISLVLVHGTGNLGAKIWDSTIAELEDSFHIVTFDLPGFGRSEKKNELYSPANYARFIDWIVHKYASQPVYLVGHSMGGAISLYYAGIYPDQLERLILIDAAGILHRSAFTRNMLESQLTGEVNVGKKNLIESPLSALKYMVGTAIENLDEALVPNNIGSLLKSETFRKTVLNGDPILISGMALIQTDFSPILDKVKAPTVIIWGEKDSIAPLRTGKLLAYRIKHSSLSVLNSLGHSPMLEDSETFNSILLQSIIDPTIVPFTKIEDRKQNKTELTSREVFNSKNQEVTGNYKNLTIKSSKGIVIKDVTAQHLKIEDSEVTMENSWVAGKEIGLDIINSIVYLTGTNISGNTAIRVYNSNVDLAGSYLKGKNNLIKSERESTIVFSVCKVESPKMKGSVHKIIRLYLGDSF